MPARALQDASEHSAVVLLDSDMVSVDIWQLVNWPTRWARALREMSAGKALVLPAFQLTPGGVAAAAARGEAVGLAAMRDALEVATAGTKGRTRAGKIADSCGARCAVKLIMKLEQFAGVLRRTCALRHLRWFALRYLNRPPPSSHCPLQKRASSR